MNYYSNKKKVFMEDILKITEFTKTFGRKMYYKRGRKDPFSNIKLKLFTRFPITFLSFLISR